jgi:hypothetical protein
VAQFANAFVRCVSFESSLFSPLCRMACRGVQYYAAFMRRTVLYVLTWLTVAGAVVSALWLASVDPGWPEWRHLSDTAAGLPVR